MWGLGVLFEVVVVASFAVEAWLLLTSTDLAEDSRHSM